MRATITPGMTIGPYTIVRPIGAGGMGDVFLANEDRLKRQVALKVISPEIAEKENNLRRFKAEGQTLALINHKNVVSVYAIDCIDGYNFIAMEYIEGKPLGTLVKNFVFPANEAAPIFVQMCEGLAALHEKSVIHRDIKPHNIIFQKDSLIKIIDLGIAKSYTNQDISATTVGVVMGTVQYLAPEISMGRPATALSDVWAMGAIFYEMLVGSPLINAKNFAQAMAIVSNLKITFAPDCAATIPPEMQDIVRRMCEPDPEKRIRSASEAAQIIRQFMAKYPSQGKWFYRYCGRDIKNTAEVKQRLLQRGHSEFQAKEIIFWALQEIDTKKNQAIDTEKTVALEIGTPTGETLSDENLTLAMKSLTRISRIHTTRVRMKKTSRALTYAVGAAVLVGAGVFGWKTFKPQPLPVAAPVAVEKPAPPPAAVPEPAPKPEPAPVVVKAAEPVAPEVPAPPEFSASATPPSEPKPKATPPAAPAAPKISMATVTPKLKGNIQLNLKDGSPELSWDKIPGAAAYELQISKTRAFSETEVKETLHQPIFSWTNPTPGNYFFRVRGKAKDGQFSNYSPPAQMKLTIPPVSLPAEISRTASKESFQINWQAQPFESQFRVMISRDPAFSSTEKTFVVRKPAADIALHEAGTYYTRVAAVDPQDNEVSAYSNVSKITLKAMKEEIKLAAPTLLSPPKDAKIPSVQGAAMLLIYWSKVEKADSYDLQIAGDEAFSKVVVEKNSTTNRFTLKQDLGKGVRYWRARSVSGEGKSAWTLGRFEIQ